MTHIDAKGQPCPMPVILARKELQKGEAFKITVDNETAVQNLTRLAKTMGCTLEKTEEGGFFTIAFSAPTKTGKENTVAKESYAVFFNKNTVGSGDDVLGENLAKMMLYTLTQSEDVPDYVLLMNGGVRLATNEETAEHLAKLAEQGCSVMVCGTCLNYFGIADDLKCGTVSNMYDILAAMQNVAKVITV